jgi:hypothetical protein
MAAIWYLIIGVICRQILGCGHPSRSSTAGITSWSMVTECLLPKSELIFICCWCLSLHRMGLLPDLTIDNAAGLWHLKMIHSCFPIFLIIVLISIFQKIHFTVIIKTILPSLWMQHLYLIGYAILLIGQNIREKHDYNVFWEKNVIAIYSV